MPRVKDTTKKKVLKTAPVLGAAGLSFAMIGGASAAAVPTADVALSPTAALDHQKTLGVEEIADVSLATFYVFDKENTASAKGGVQVAWRGCGGCRGCRGRSRSSCMRITPTKSMLRSMPQPLACDRQVQSC